MPTHYHEPSHNELAIIIAFYISKYDRQALEKLGYSTYTEAFTSIAEIIGVKANYLKFRRDEFDPIHPWRKGWIREMDRRIISAIEALQDLTEQELEEIVMQILNDEAFRTSEQIQKITTLFSYDERVIVKNYVLRGPTGRKAEEEFISYFNKYKLPVEGVLIDTRDEGTGYDFRIERENEQWFIEVKGSSEISGGILFTSKEWQVAKIKKDKYFVVILSNINAVPTVKIIQDPASKLKPKRNIIRTIQVSWSISAEYLETII